MMLPRVETPVKSLAALILAPIYQKKTLTAVGISGDDPTCFECQLSLGHCPISMQSWRMKYYPLSFSLSIHHHPQSK
jgi:hypothetical protein